MEGLCEEVEKLIKKDQFEEALEKIEEYGVLPKESTKLWTWKARCLQKLEKHDDAFHAAYEVFKLTYTYKKDCGCSVGILNVGILNTLAEGYSRKGEYDMASDMYLLASDHCEKKEHKDHFLEKSREADSKLGVAWVVEEAALKLFQENKFNEALETIETSGVLPVDSQKLLVLKVRCLSKLDRVKDVSQAVSTILEASANNVTVLLELGKGYMEEGDYGSAIHVLQRGRDSALDKETRLSFIEEYRKALDKKIKEILMISLTNFQVVVASEKIYTGHFRCVIIRHIDSKGVQDDLSLSQRRLQTSMKQ